MNYLEASSATVTLKLKFDYPMNRANMGRQLLYTFAGQLRGWSDPSEDISIVRLR